MDMSLLTFCSMITNIESWHIYSVILSKCVQKFWCLKETEFDSESIKTRIVVHSSAQPYLDPHSTVHLQNLQLDNVKRIFTCYTIPNGQYV